MYMSVKLYTAIPKIVEIIFITVQEITSTQKHFIDKLPSKRLRDCDESVIKRGHQGEFC